MTAQEMLTHCEGIVQERKDFLQSIYLEETEAIDNPRFTEILKREHAIRYDELSRWEQLFRELQRQALVRSDDPF